MISIKYLVSVLRVDNKGEGGILAPTALLGTGNAPHRWRKVLILLGLFALQRKGTSAVGSLFGPIVCVWFAVLTVLGLAGIWRNPEVLYGLSPHHAVEFFGGRG